MNNDIISLLSSKKMVVNQYIINIAIKNKLSLNEFLVLVYFDNDITKVFDIEKISEALCLDSGTMMEAFNGLMIKGLVKLESVKDKSLKMINEVVSIDEVYKQVVSDIKEDTKEKVEEDIYSKFEMELGKTLSTMQIEILNAWINNGISEEIILGALKEAVYNGVTNFSYIDKIIYEWNKRGFKTMEDVNKYQASRRQQKSKDKDTMKKEQAILDYDWLDGE